MIKKKYYHKRVTKDVVCHKCEGLGYIKKIKNYIDNDYIDHEIVYKDCKLCNNRGWRRKLIKKIKPV